MLLIETLCCDAQNYYPTHSVLLSTNSIWAVPRENQPYELCVKYRPGSIDFLFQKSILYTSIPMIRNVSARIRLRELRRLIWVYTWRINLNVRFLVERLICFWGQIRIFEQVPLPWFRAVFDSVLWVFFNLQAFAFQTKSKCAHDSF